MPCGSRLSLLETECHVWWASTTSTSLGLLSYLAVDERARWASYRREADRARYLAAHALARLVLAGHLDLPAASIVFASDLCRRCGEPHGKPRAINDAGIEISITHSGTMAGFAATLGNPIGIDVEDLGRADHGSLAGAVLSGCEQAALAGCPDREYRHRLLLSYCTRKEALLKATGDGLTLPMRRLSVADPTRPPRLIAWEDRPWLVAHTRMYELHPAAGHVASLAAIGADLQVREFSGDGLLEVAAAQANG